MNTRKEISALLLLLGLILALLPLTANRSFTTSPGRVLFEVMNEDISLTVDQVATLIAREDPGILLIDLRPAEDYRQGALPGAINLPYAEFIKGDPDRWLNNKDVRKIFYSAGDIEPGYAVVYCAGLGYENCFVMTGGMYEWITTVMETRFTGDRLTARENTLFEIRKKAGEMFTEINSLPDSLKLKYLEARKFSARKLDGGCE